MSSRRSEQRSYSYRYPPTCSDNIRARQYTLQTSANMNALFGSVLLMFIASRPAVAGSLKDVEHVVIFMQENRSWNNVSSK